MRALQPANEGGQDAGGFKELMTTFGAVKVGGRNFFKLLKNGEAVLLFPGGVREVRGLTPLQTSFLSTCTFRNGGGICMDAQWQSLAMADADVATTAWQ